MSYVRVILQSAFIVLLGVSVVHKANLNHVEALYTLVLAVSVMQCVQYFKGIE